MIEFITKYINMLFGDKAKNILTLLQKSFSLLGEEELRNLLLARICFTLFCYAWVLTTVTLFSFDYHTGLAFFMALVAICILYPYSFFYHVRARARQTWFAYAKITNHPDAVTEARVMVAKQKWTLRMFAIAELSFRNAHQNSGNERRGLMSMLAGAALTLLEGLYAVAENYLLPAVVIERLSLTDASRKLQQLQNNLPETLTGIFGINVLGGLAAGLLSMAGTALFIVGASLAYSLPKLDLISQQYVIYGPAGLPPLFLFPLLCAMLLSSFLNRLVRILTTSVQACYFAIFYTRINKPQELTPEMQQSVDQYLLTPVVAR